MFNFEASLLLCLFCTSGLFRWLLFIFLHFFVSCITDIVLVPLLSWHFHPSFFWVQPVFDPILTAKSVYFTRSYALYVSSSWFCRLSSIWLYAFIPFCIVMLSASVFFVFLQLGIIILDSLQHTAGWASAAQSLILKKRKPASNNLDKDQ